MSNPEATNINGYYFKDAAGRSLLSEETSLRETQVNTLNNQVLDLSQRTASVEAEYSDTVKKDEASSVTMDMLTQEVKEALTGGSTAVVGANSVDTANIADGAVTIFKLDNYMQADKIVSYGDKLAIGSRYAGYYEDNDGVATLVGTSNPDFANYVVSLEKGKIYAYNGFDYFTLMGLAVVDSENNIIYKTPNPNLTTSPASLIFRANTTGLRALMSIRTSIIDSTGVANSIYKYMSPTLRDVSKIINKIDTLSLRLVQTIENGFVDYRTELGVARITSYNGTNVKVYEMCKGVRYSVHATNWSGTAGLCIIKLDGEIIYKSSDAAISGNTLIPVDYDWTANQPGYILLTERPGYYGYSLSIKDGYLRGSTNGDLGFNKWFALGDSITNKNFRAAKNYVDYIEEELGIDTVNLGISGAGYKKVSNSKTIIDEIADISSYNYQTDIITVLGSINDFEYIADNLGELGDQTNSTLYGCMYLFCNTLLTAYPGARIGIIAPSPTGVYNSDNQKFVLYNKALKETAELFNIPFFDLSVRANLRPWITDFKNTFFSADGEGNHGEVDTVHPNSKGHYLMHDAIKEFIRSL